MAATLLLALAACASRSPARTPGVESPDHALAIERGRNIVAPLVRRGSGVAVAVGVGGELVWSEGFGVTAREGGAPVRPDMPFRVYSLMKQVTAVLALQSAGLGEVDLRAPVTRVLPDLPPAYDGVTPLHLLTHTAGVRHYRDEVEARMTAHCATAAEALPRFVDDPLVAEPGARESYSTYGFVLASAVLERAAGRPFDELLTARILEPAGMTATGLEGEGEGAGQGGGGDVVYYDVDSDGVTTRAPRLDNSCKMGGGGFVMSVEDLVRFHNAVLSGELVPLAAVRQMLGGRTALDAGGTGFGGQAVSRVDLATGVSVVVASNTSGLEQRMALERARELLAGVFAP